MSSSMFPNPDARAAQEAEGRGWQMENRVNRRFQEAVWAYSCDTLETVESLYCSEASYIPASAPGLAAAQFTY